MFRHATWHNGPLKRAVHLLASVNHQTRDETLPISQSDLSSQGAKLLEQSSMACPAGVASV